MRGWRGGDRAAVWTLGCGTGVHLAALAEAGWSVVGVDTSADQLRVAGRRAGPVVAGLVQADAARLPFSAGSCTLVVSAFTHTDVEDFTSLAREARRVLEPDGCFVYGGLTSRVGFRHLPLGHVLNGVLEAELRLCRVEEDGMSQLLEWLALVAQP